MVDIGERGNLLWNGYWRYPWKSAWQCRFSILLLNGTWSCGENLCESVHGNQFSWIPWNHDSSCGVLSLCKAMLPLLFLILKVHVQNLVGISMTDVRNFATYKRHSYKVVEQEFRYSSFWLQSPFCPMVATLSSVGCLLQGNHTDSVIDSRH